ncbi:Hypp3881 [Branchiostoma lanceolatum]|uniref:Hypp3881 protein n=1 Tax=Branchiostoma lanceolatum TaxID=7740 RepID=A0A8K0A5G2_BRALA|nr:Hypp3881 [Branchiostoma lanceolatum]
MMDLISDLQSARIPGLGYIPGVSSWAIQYHVPGILFAVMLVRPREFQEDYDQLLQARQELERHELTSDIEVLLMHIPKNAVPPSVEPNCCRPYPDHLWDKASEETVDGKSVMAWLSAMMEGSICKPEPERDKSFTKDVTLDCVNESEILVVIKLERRNEACTWKFQKIETPGQMDRKMEDRRQMYRKIEACRQMHLEEYVQQQASLLQNQMTLLLLFLVLYRVPLSNLKKEGNVCVDAQITCTWLCLKYCLLQNLLLMLMLFLVLNRSNLRDILRYHNTNVLIVDLLTYSKQINGFTESL